MQSYCDRFITLHYYKTGKFKLYFAPNAPNDGISSC